MMFYTWYGVASYEVAQIKWYEGLNKKIYGMELDYYRMFLINVGFFIESIFVKRKL